MSTETLQVPPNSSRLIESLRSTGYDFNSAVADLIDNSVAADASLVEIIVKGEAQETLRVFIADNGHGMNREELVNAMTYGSVERDNPKSLGKFGLGLKTASSSICRSFSVLSRKDSQSPVVKACWDLDHVSSVGDWELLLPHPTAEELDILERTTGNGSGTVVSWSKIDRLFESQEAPAASEIGEMLQAYVSRLQFYLAAVFERFLNPDDSRTRTLSMSVNGAELQPWNPFFSEQEKTETLTRYQLDAVVESTGAQGSMDLQAFILPREEEFVDRVEAENARLIQYRQGFYVYRENRLIQFHDWLGLLEKSPVYTLLRCELSFGAELDDIFHVDIKKSRMVLSEKLKSWLDETFLPEPKEMARKRFMLGQRLKALAHADQAHEESNRRISQHADDLELATLREYARREQLASISNRQGVVQRKLPEAAEPLSSEQYISPVSKDPQSSIWQPCVVGDSIGVELNTAHPFYSRVYLPHIAESVTVQALDAFLWALVQAELSLSDANNAAEQNQFRNEVSRLLSKLLETLPEPLL